MRGRSRNYLKTLYYCIHKTYCQLRSDYDGVRTLLGYVRLGAFEHLSLTT